MPLGNNYLVDGKGGFGIVALQLASEQMIERMKTVPMCAAGIYNVRNVGIPNSALTELMTGRESKILGIEPEICQALHDKYDWDLCTIPANTYPGQTEDIQTVAVKSVLTVREDCPDAVAYFLAKTMYEEKPYFETVQSAYAKFGPEDMVQGLTVELHPGAKAFWEETGLLK